MFKTIGVACELTSSDITTPSQLMHAVRFNIALKTFHSKDLTDLLADHPLIARTSKFDSNVVFEQGRRYGFNGRIYSHAIIIHQNILISEKRIKGWAFVPQEGNSIISTLHAYLLQTKQANSDQIISKIVDNLCRAEW
jgi:glyceraldehyde-3-phosphate dehydrogenase (NAD(P))